jgi:hypothetical protein
MDTLRDIIISKTRKPHKCFGCRRTIEAGNRMGYVVVADAGTVYGDYFCDTCTMIRYGMYLHPMDTISEGSLEELALAIEAEAKKLLDNELKEKNLEFIGGKLNDSRSDT